VSTRKNPVDSVFRPGYKLRHISTVTAVLLAAGTVSAKDAAPARGAVLPPGSKQVGESRFQSPSSFADTLTFYGKTYRDSPRKTIVNQPGIRAIHIVNDGKGDWEGLNVYELDGETRIFVVPKDAPARSVDKKSR